MEVGRLLLFIDCRIHVLVVFYCTMSIVAAISNRCMNFIHQGPAIARRCSVWRPQQHPQQVPQRRIQPFITTTAIGTHPTSITTTPSTRIITRLYTSKIAVIGGGASGIFAAIAAAESLQSIQNGNGDIGGDVADAVSGVGADSGGDNMTKRQNEVEIIVLEATNSTLSKVKISGGGRCNVLHDTNKPVMELLQGYPRGRKELTGLFHSRFSPSTARHWFESRGVELKTESDGRMFPITDSSQTIIDTLLQAASRANVQIQFRTKVEGISIINPSPTTNNNNATTPTTTTSVPTTTASDEESRPRRFCVKTQSKSPSRGPEAPHMRTVEDLYFDAVILATGSTPAGYRIAQGLDLAMIPPAPSLFTLNASPNEILNTDGLLYDLAGISIPWAEVAFYIPGQKKPLHTDEGPLLITHHGLSGPAILRMSAFGARDLAQVQYQGILRVNWAPHLGSGNDDESITDIANQLWQSTLLMPKKQIDKFCPLPSRDETTNKIRKTTIGGHTIAALPRRLWAALVQRAGGRKEQLWATASKAFVRTLATLMVQCDIAIQGKSTYKDEFVTAGGIDLRQVNMKTLQSKVYPGLFICGELLNVDGVTGGYNFMNCWSTGHVAGQSAATYILSQKEHHQQQEREEEEEQQQVQQQEPTSNQENGGGKEHSLLATS